MVLINIIFLVCTIIVLYIISDFNIFIGAINNFLELKHLQCKTGTRTIYPDVLYRVSRCKNLYIDYNYLVKKEIDYSNSEIPEKFNNVLLQFISDNREILNNNIVTKTTALVANPNNILYDKRDFVYRIFEDYVNKEILEKNNQDSIALPRPGSLIYPHQDDTVVFVDRYTGVIFGEARDIDIFCKKFRYNTQGRIERYCNNKNTKFILFIKSPRSTSTAITIIGKIKINIKFLPETATIIPLIKEQYNNDINIYIMIPDKSWITQMERLKGNDIYYTLPPTTSDGFFDSRGIALGLYRENGIYVLGEKRFLDIFDLKRNDTIVGSKDLKYIKYNDISPLAITDIFNLSKNIPTCELSGFLNIVKSSIHLKLSNLGIRSHGILFYSLLLVTSIFLLLLGWNFESIMSGILLSIPLFYLERLEFLDLGLEQKIIKKKDIIKGSVIASIACIGFDLYILLFGNHTYTEGMLFYWSLVYATNGFARWTTQSANSILVNIIYCSLFAYVFLYI